MDGSFENTFNALSIDQLDDNVDVKEVEETAQKSPRIVFQCNAPKSEDIEPLNIDTINFDDDKDFQPVKNRRAKNQTRTGNQTRKPRMETDVIADDLTTDSKLFQSFKLSNIVNNTSHYIELAKEGINCMCSKALRNIQARQDKITSGTWSMNILGPIFCNDFYVRFDSKKYALVKEDVVRSGKIELDGKEYPINSQDSIRIWDLICGPNDRPTLFKENNMLEFIFSSFWTFIGTVILLEICIKGIIIIIQNLKR